MTTPYRIACLFVLILASAGVASAYYGWGLPDDASLRAKGNVRQGSIHGRRHLYGGPSFGK